MENVVSHSGVSAAFSVVRVHERHRFGIGGTHSDGNLGEGVMQR